jgi:phosphohistidine phosphatase
MQIFLLRHGDALQGMDDFARPLSAKGIADINKIAHYLQNQQVGIQQIFHSGLVRAEQSAEIMANILRVKMLKMPGLAPYDAIEAIIPEIYALDKSTLFVTHLPFVGMLLEALTGRYLDFQTATVACLQEQKQHWEMQFYIHANEIVD